MKIKVSQLRRIIREEASRYLTETEDVFDFGRLLGQLKERIGNPEKDRYPVSAVIDKLKGAVVKDKAEELGKSEELAKIIRLSDKVFSSKSPSPGRQVGGLTTSDVNKMNVIKRAKVDLRDAIDAFLK